MALVIKDDISQMITTTTPTRSYTFHEIFHNQITNCLPYILETSRIPSSSSWIVGKYHLTPKKKHKVSNHKILVANYGSETFLLKDQCFRCLCDTARALALTELYKPQVFMKNVMKVMVCILQYVQLQQQYSCLFSSD